MGIFSSKKDTPKPIKVIYYEGDLPNFGANTPSQIHIEENTIKISKINPDITINLDPTKIQSVDIYWKEEEYMLKYHGNAAHTSKSKNMNKIYFMIHYLTDEKSLSFSFWCTALEISAINKWKESITKRIAPVEISL